MAATVSAAPFRPWRPLLWLSGRYFRFPRRPHQAHTRPRVDPMPQRPANSAPDSGTSPVQWAPAPGLRGPGAQAPRDHKWVIPALSRPFYPDPKPAESARLPVYGLCVILCMRCLYAMDGNRTRYVATDAVGGTAIQQAGNTGRGLRLRKGDTTRPKNGSAGLFVPPGRGTRPVHQNLRSMAAIFLHLSWSALPPFFLSWSLPVPFSPVSCYPYPYS